MKPVNVYVRLSISAMLLLLCWGLFAPLLISSEADIGVLAGIIIVLGAPIGVYYIFKPLFIKPTKKVKK